MKGLKHLPYKGMVKCLLIFSLGWKNTQDMRIIIITYYSNYIIMHSLPSQNNRLVGTK